MASKNVEVYGYDADGNLMSDGRWTYTWDAENRLSSMQAIAAAPVAAKLRLEFLYDYMCRRIQKKVYVWNVGTGTYQLQTTTRFVYDGRNLAAELDGNNNPVRSFTWGTDVSGSLQAAGGIGGLLLINDGCPSQKFNLTCRGSFVRAALRSPARAIRFACLASCA